MRRVRQEAQVLRAGGAAGFSIVELIIALAVATIAAIGIYSVFISQNKESISQKSYSDTQNNLRYAMDFMKNELFLAGFNAKENPSAPILTALSTEVGFEYYDENLDLTKRVRSDLDGTLDPSHYTPNVKVKYSLANPVTKSDGVVVKDLVRTTEIWNSQNDPLNPGNPIGYVAATPAGSPNINQEVLARDIVSAAGLVFSYKKSDNAAWVSGTDPKADIRTIRIALKGRSHGPDPYAGNYRTLKISGEVKSRNLAIAENPLDNDPPGAPQSLAVRDPRECGRLLLQWDGMSDSDLKGFAIYYGLAPGQYLGKRTVQRAPSATPESYLLTGLSSYDATYYIAIRAFDNSGNMSGFSNEAWGDPGTDSTAFGGGDDHGDDSTINPEIPDPPTFLPPVYPADNQVELTWTPSTTPGVVGYRLFRSRMADYSDEALVEDESLLTVDAPPYYLNQGSDLWGCTEYYYRMVAIHCDSSEFDNGNYDDPVTHYDEVTAIPTDGQAPETPILEARAGFQRVILNIDNPDRDAAADPDFLYTKVYWSTAAYPTITGGAGLNITVDSPPIPNSRPIALPDPGIIQTEGTSGGAINFNHETAERPASDPPQLSSTDNYYFLAIAFDTCGNHSLVTDDARDLGIQCGDCPPAEIVCDEVPAGQLPTNIGATGCDYTLDFTWTPPNMTTYYDHAGFHVFRREGATWTADSTTEVSLTGDTAWWFPYWNDSTAVMGKQYSYKICSVDCYYDQHWQKSPGDWPDASDDPKNNINCVTIDDGNLMNSLYLGSFFESSNPGSPVTGDIQDLFADVDQDFQHNTATIFLDNLAAGPMTQEALQLTWENTGLFLTDAFVGDGSTTTREVVYDGASQPAIASATGFTFTPPKSVDGLDDAVPMTFHFAKADGTVDRDVDMRQEVFNLSMTTQNNSTTDTCSYDDSNVFVPLGPLVRAVVQDRPDNPTPAWPIPGDSGVNVMDKVIVPADVGVNIRAIVLDTFPNDGIAGVRLFYVIDAGAILSNPPAISDFNLTNSIVMNNVSGFLFQTATPIPASNDANVWYYVLARDNNGNFDRSPEIESGAYQYFQQPADVCNNTPDPPVIGGSATASDVTLSWTAPALNTDGSPFTDVGGYNIYRSDGGSWGIIGTNAAGDTNFVDAPGDLAPSNYSYAVTAFDTCPAPAANESAASNVFTECVGAPSCILTLTPPAGTPLYDGDTIDVQMTVCAKNMDGTANDIVHIQACTDAGASSIEMLEVNDTGYFQVNSGAYGGSSDIQLHDTLPGTTTALDLDVDSASDTVTVGAYSDTPFGGSCASGSFSCDEQTFPVVADPCAAPATPSQPLNLQVIEETSCNANNGSVSLSWSAPTSGPVTAYHVYLCQDTACLSSSQLDTVTGTTWDNGGANYSPGGKLSATVLTFTVTAENAICPTDPKVSPIAVPDTDGCP